MAISASAMKRLCSQSTITAVVSFVSKRAYMQTSHSRSVVSYAQTITTPYFEEEVETRVSTRPMPYTAKDGEINLYQHVVPVKSRGVEIPLNAVFLDTHPEGSSKGTVVFTNGAPGSHKDFKYVTPMLAEDGIRVIGINYPGMGYTPYDSRLRETSDERLQFVQGILDAVNVNDNLVFAGHSRGSEDALKLGLLNKKGTEGVVLVNPVGLRPHRGISPYPLLLWWSWQWKVMTGPLQFLVNPFYKFLYDLYKVSVDSGEMAGMCLNLMANTDYPGQRKFIEQLNESDLNVLLACAGRDHLIEPEITRELLSAFKGLKQMTCTAQGQDAEITAQTTSELRSGTKRLGVYFTEDGHHLQKHRPHFIYKAITAMFDAKRNQ